MRWTCLLASLCIATPAVADPDFVTPERARPYAASGALTPAQPREDVVFLHDSWQLSPVAQQQVATAAHWLRVHHHTTVVLEGHTDVTGEPLYNADLATARADRVRGELIKLGVKPERIVIVSYGEAGAQRDVNPNDRRVVMFATDDPIDHIIKPSFERGALAVTWTRDGRPMREVSFARVTAQR